MKRNTVIVIFFIICGVGCATQMWRDYQFEKQVENLANHKKTRLKAYAVLNAHSYSQGPQAGAQLTPKARAKGNFLEGQPIMGLSALSPQKDGTFLSVVDNGFGRQDNSVDFLLRVYVLKPNFKKLGRGSGNIEVLNHIQLSDPNHFIDFPIVHHFTHDRQLTGADFDIEAMAQAKDGTLWFGDGFGPFLFHTDAQGHLIEPPYAIEIEKDEPWVAIESPLVEEGNVLRLVQALYSHAKKHGSPHRPMIAPSHLLLRDKIKKTFVKTRKTPPEDSDLEEASSEIFDMKSLKKSGFLTVPYTVNKKKRMRQLLSRGAAGIITDRPDKLYAVLKKKDKKQKGLYLDHMGLVDPQKFLAVGHRGARGLLPENTLPSIEKALDNYMNTIEVDIVITQDNVSIINHDLSLSSKKCRRVDRQRYRESDEQWIYNLSSRFITTQMICDKSLPIKNRSKTPEVSAAFSKGEAMPSSYSVMTLYQLLKFMKFYEAYYSVGEGKSHPKSVHRATNAARAVLHLEVKRNPRSDLGSDGKPLFERSAAADHFAFSVGWLLRAFKMEHRARLQSFDFNTLLIAQEHFPEIQTVYLFGDYPMVQEKLQSGNPGLNLQDTTEAKNPFLAGMVWPYRQSWSNQKNKIRKRGGISGITIHTEQEKIYAVLEKPLKNAEAKTIKILSFDMQSRTWDKDTFSYKLEPQGSAIDAIVWVGGVRFLILERDGKEGDLSAHKIVFDVTLDEDNYTVQKQPLVDLMHVFDPNSLAYDGKVGDIGRTPLFAMPFSSIGGLGIMDRRHIALVNDNNYPVGRGRHVQEDVPDDSELVIIQLAEPLW
jgi:glycerophosphoryl diester phosphodiesterase